MNYDRKSTTGTTPAFPILNVVGFTSLFLQYTAFYYSPLIRSQYRERNHGEETTTRFNDVLFTVHAVLMSAIILSQFWHGLWGFERRQWKLSKVVSGIIGLCILAVIVAIGLVVVEGEDGGRDPTSWAWIDVIYVLGAVKVAITFFKYIPQAWSNYQRKSTVGWSIDQILMDVVGGSLSILQLVIDSSLQSDWSGITGNPAKLLLGQISLAFDVVFLLQHYVWYRNADKVKENSKANRRDSSNGESGRPLLPTNDEEAVS